MTAISRKYKNKSDKGNFLSSKDCALAVAYGLAGFMAARASWCDIPLYSLCIILAVCCDDILYRYAIITGGVIACGIMSVSNAQYIPYFVSYMVLAAAGVVVKKDSYMVIPALTVLAVAKIALTYGGMPLGYQLSAVAEAVAVYILVFVVKTGIRQLLENIVPQNYTDGVYSLVVVLCIVLAFSGGDSHWLYPGFALAMAGGWYFISAGRLSDALITLVTASVSLADKRGFVYLLLCCCLLWLTGGYFAEKLSLGIYPCAIALAVVFNIVFVSQINSFALTGSTALALIIYFFAGQKGFMTSKTDVPDLIAGRDWRLLMLSLKKLEGTLSYLAGCVIDISRLNEKSLKAEQLEDIVAEDVCRRCEKNSVCWQEKYSFTRQQFAEYGKKIYWRGDNRFSQGFCHQCIHIGEVTKSFEENSRLLLSKKYILQSQKNNQRLLQNAFVSVSSAIGDLICKSQHSYLLNTTLTMETDRFLKEMGINHTCCLCSQNPDMVTISVLQPLDEKQLYKIQSHTEKLYGVKFMPAIYEKRGVELLYIFNARPLYSYETAVESNRYKAVNGDRQEIFTYNGSLYVIISDGMGTGYMASAESRTVIAMAKSLITTGVSIKTAIEIINLSLNLKGSGETSASADILAVDLFTGKCTVTKAGAGVSLVIDKNGVNRHYKDSLPLGIVKDVKPVECDFTVKAGDIVLMMSDGVGVISGDIKQMYGKDCSQAAKTAIGQNNTDDDKTVVAVKLKIAI